MQGSLCGSGTEMVTAARTARETARSRSMLAEDKGLERATKLFISLSVAVRPTAMDCADARVPGGTDVAYSWDHSQEIFLGSRRERRAVKCVKDCAKKFGSL